MTAPYERSSAFSVLGDLASRISDLEAVPGSVKVACGSTPGVSLGPSGTSAFMSMTIFGTMFTNDSSFYKFATDSGFNGGVHVEAPLGGCYLMIAGTQQNGSGRTHEPQCVYYEHNIAANRWDRRQPLSLGYNLIGTTYHSIGIWDRNLSSGYDKVGFSIYCTDTSGTNFGGASGGGWTIMRFASLPLFFGGIGVETFTCPASTP